jgi:hypothetical protein
MTSTEKLQQHYSTSMSNAEFLHAGFIHSSVPTGSSDADRVALELGALQMLAAMLVLGGTCEKSFARSKLKKLIATGKRLARAKAKTMPKTEGAQL